MRKKVIEQEHKYGSIEVESFTPENLTLTQINDFTCDEVVVSKSKATTVAKAIDPDYQKVIDEVEFLRAERPVNIAIRNENKTLKDQNAKLVEALEKVKKDMEWMWENLSKPHTSDHFNIPANAINSIEEILNTKQC